MNSKSSLTCTLTLPVFALAVLGLAPPAAAQSPVAIPTTVAALTRMKPDALELLFWQCDYVATTKSTGATLEECYTITEAFKQARFAGDYDALFAYWHQQKPARHERLRKAEQPR